MFLPKPPAREQAEKSVKTPQEAERGRRQRRNHTANLPPLTLRFCWARSTKHRLHGFEWSPPTHFFFPHFEIKWFVHRLLEFYSWAALFFCCGDPCCLPGTWPTRLERGWVGDGGTDKIGSLWQVGSLRLQTVALSKEKKRTGGKKRCHFYLPTVSAL